MSRHQAAFHKSTFHESISFVALILLMLTASGCATTSLSGLDRHAGVIPIRPLDTPRELCKSTLPKYRIEPPDVLDINVVRLVPNANYLLNTTDVLSVSVTRKSLDTLVSGDIVSVRVPGAPAVSPIEGNFIVQPDGTINLGTPYGSIRIADMTLEAAGAAIEKLLAKYLVAPETFVALSESANPVDGEYAIEIDGNVDFGDPYGVVSLDGVTITEARRRLESHFSRFFSEATVSISILQSSALQQIIGEHSVGPDGYVQLGSYGSVRVVGMTLEEANFAIADMLSVELDEPQVSTTVLAYNSKLFYIITQGAGIGDGVFRFPITGNETVLDAISLINGFPQGSSTQMWIARPNPNRGNYHVLPVDWERVAALGESNTNYQLLPGDRLYIKRDPLLHFDTSLAKLTAPLERVLGFSILGASAATRLSGPVLQGGGNPLQGRGGF